MYRYPTLALIDQACGGVDPRFRDDPNAAHLEQRARELADTYWCDRVWLTGVIPSPVFQVVCDALERERLDHPVTVLVATVPDEPNLDTMAASDPHELSTPVLSGGNDRLALGSLAP